MDSGHLGMYHQQDLQMDGMGCVRAKEKSKTTLRFLIRAPERLELSFAEMGSTLG